MSRQAAAPAPTLPPPGPEPVWSEFADMLRGKPGVWEPLGQQLAKSTAYHIRTGRYAAFRPAGTFDATLRNTRGNRADVYVRFLGKRPRS